MELADVLDSKSSAARRAGSSPATGIAKKGTALAVPFFAMPVALSNQKVNPDGSPSNPFPLIPPITFGRRE